MPRFPTYERNVLALGKLLARAASDPALKKQLQENPKEELRRIGLPEQTVELFHFHVVDEAAMDKPPVVLPYRLNDARLAQKDDDYLTQVSEIVPATRLN
ncbi:hypothetical protein [Roseibium sp.]|uniref:hypothetical protein n=1 Tax=Roseibium sp. TaxID=1936156 RepID=UPI003A971575